MTPEDCLFSLLGVRLAGSLCFTIETLEATSQVGKQQIMRHPGTDTSEY